MSTILNTKVTKLEDDLTKEKARSKELKDELDETKLALEAANEKIGELEVEETEARDALQKEVDDLRGQVSSLQTELNTERSLKSHLSRNPNDTDQLYRDLSSSYQSVVAERDQLKAQQESSRKEAQKAPDKLADAHKVHSPPTSSIHFRTVFFLGVISTCKCLITCETLFSRFRPPNRPVADLENCYRPRLRCSINSPYRHRIKRKDEATD
jgi:hypothetical protein